MVKPPVRKESAENSYVIYGEELDMSRLGKLPIKVPAGVEVKTDGKTIHVKGPKGTLSFPLTEGITVKVVDGMAIV